MHRTFAFALPPTGTVAWLARWRWQHVSGRRYVCVQSHVCSTDWQAGVMTERVNKAYLVSLLLFTAPAE